jgi:5-methylcytosine-specific restriction endonuclease McrA
MMRKLVKLDEPQLLTKRKDYWNRKVVQTNSDYYKTKYRSRPIKEQLKKETYGKCIYCESKIGHNTPGDVEHKVPVSANADGRFDWHNLTIACTECNRRKNDYYNTNARFIDPYIDDVESIVLHFGPCVINKPGDEIGEISIRILEINDRYDLFAQKLSKVKAVMNLLNRIASANNPVLKRLLISEAENMAHVSAEFSAMVKTIIEDRNAIQVSTT